MGGMNKVIALPSVAIMVAMLAIGTAGVASAADTPTTPIDADQMSTIITTGGPNVDAACEANAGTTAAITELVSLTGGDADVLAMMMQLVDSYEITQLEGDSLRLTPEARVVLLDWLHESCV